MKNAPAEASRDPAPSGQETSRSTIAPTIDSAALLRGHNQVPISHGGCIYMLRLTRGDKLILTK